MFVSMLVGSFAEQEQNEGLHYYSGNSTNSNDNCVNKYVGAHAKYSAKLSSINYCIQFNTFCCHYGCSERKFRY